MAKNAVGIIAEFNPLHNGHEYLIRRAKELTGASYCIIAMSGDFVQRGAPAIFDKYERTKMALLSGADLVIEIPPIFATSSAQDFASCGVAVLDRTGVVNYLCFGSECGDIDALNGCAKILGSETEEFSSSVKESLRSGLTYPQARINALKEISQESADTLSSPNNILGAEYIKAIQGRGSLMTPVTVKREGSSHHDTSLYDLDCADLPDSNDTTFSGIIHSPESSKASASSTALRNAISDDAALSDIDSFKKYFPEKIYELVKEGHPVYPDDLSSLLSYRLLELGKAGISFDDFLDVSSDLADRISNHILDFIPFGERVSLLKTKQYTYTRISRSLIHILLDMTWENSKRRKEHDYVSYIRVLGFKRSSAELLSDIKKASSLPMITRTADARNILSEQALAEFKEDVSSSHIYQSVYQNKYNVALPNEYTRSIITI